MRTGRGGAVRRAHLDGCEPRVDTLRSEFCLRGSDSGTYLPAAPQVPGAVRLEDLERVDVPAWRSARARPGLGAVGVSRGREDVQGGAWYVESGPSRVVRETVPEGLLAWRTHVPGLEASLAVETSTRERGWTRAMAGPLRARQRRPLAVLRERERDVAVDEVCEDGELLSGVVSDRDGRTVVL